MAAIATQDPIDPSLSEDIPDGSNDNAASTPPAAAPAEPNSRKRKRSSAGSTKTAQNDGIADRPSPDKPRSSHMKRACNECRQQKLRCDVHVEPGNYQECSRCKRLKLQCRIDVNFHRVDKRNRNAEMERELVELRRRLADKESSDPQAQAQSQWPTPDTTHSFVNNQANDSLSALHQGAADSLLELRNSSDAVTGLTAPAQPAPTKKLGKTVLPLDQVNDLFQQYFTSYHPFLPVLDPDKPADHYADLSDLLFWSIIVVAARRYDDDPTLLTGLLAPFQSLLWSTVSSVTHNYHDIKALCLICTWPLPTKSTSTDPTFMLSGLMMHMALQCGLHRPSHVKDFSRIRVELRAEDVLDRLKTWAACNIVSQTTSTGCGQPPRSQYDFTLTNHDSSAALPEDLYWRLQIERFCNKISRLVYMNRADPIGISGDEQRPALISVLAEEHRNLEQHISARKSPIENLYLQAAGLNLHVSALFDQPGTEKYSQNLLELYGTTMNFLRTALDFPYLRYCGIYITQILLSAGFALMKLLNSFFAHHADIPSSRRLFNSTVHAIRSTSINNNDLPARLAEVLTQLWRDCGAGLKPPPAGEIDDSLILRVRCRMSMSTVYDSVWRWREQYQFRSELPNMTTAQLLDTANPTDPSAASAEPDGSEASFPPAGSNNGATGAGLVPPGPNQSIISTPAEGTLPVLDPNGADMNFAMFDPLMYVLDENTFGLPLMSAPMNDLSSMDNTNFFAQ